VIARAFRYAEVLATLRIVFAFVLVLVVVLAPARSARAGEPLKVLVPDTENLQYLAFWTAKADGSFTKEGVDVEVVVAPPPQRGKAPIDSALESGEVDAALLAPPVYLRMIAAKAPIVVVANLFRNDPYALLVRREIVETRNIAVDPTPVAVRERVAGLKGLAIAYPPAGYGRLKALLDTQGVDIDKDLKATALLSRDQPTPFKDKGVDAVYLLSPHLENAVAAGPGVVVVNQARGEVAELANRQTNVLVVTRRALTARRDVIIAAVRAIAAAETRIHTAQGQAEVVEALAREMPARDRRALEAAVRLYEPAIPTTPDVRAEDLAPALALIPDSVPKPELAGVDLAPFVATDIAASAAAPRRSRWYPIAIGAAVLLALFGVIRRRARAKKTARVAETDATDATE
jgi:ABC-type nitrate/sulfonate/bicarbonate transport system substrate-binding protein